MTYGSTRLPVRQLNLRLTVTLNSGRFEYLGSILYSQFIHEFLELEFYFWCKLSGFSAERSNFLNNLNQYVIPDSFGIELELCVVVS